MGNIVFFLKLCCHSNLLFSHDYIMIILCVYPADSFKCERCCDLINSTDVCRGLQNLKVIICSFLLWLVYGLHNNSDSTFIVGVFSVISVKKADSLLGHMLFLNPEFNERRNLFYVHKLNIIDMSVLLPLYYYTGRNAFITHCFWVWLVIFAGPVNFVPDLRRGQAVIAFYITWVNSFAFQFFLFQVMIERNVCSIRYILSI